MGLLTGDIATAVFKAFKGKLKEGRLRRETPGTTLNSFGDPTSPTITYFDVEGFTDETAKMFKGQAIPEDEILVNIFAKSSATLTPNKDDKVTFDSTWYQLRAVAIDPAGALWVCKAFLIEEPTDP